MNELVAAERHGIIGATAALPPLLEVSAVTKSFGPVVACSDISLRVRPGEILGLLGENGAGKSTLMKIVVGVERADSGCVRVDGHDLHPGDPLAAASAGIGMVHQHFSLVGRLAVWQNVVLGDHKRLNERRAVELVSSIGERFGLEVDPYARVEELSAGLRQRVEIIKCLRGDPKVIILDEPTSVLTAAESTHLFEVLRGLVYEHGYSAVLISHRLSEILQATDNVTVLRHGRVAAEIETRSTDAVSLANLMLGRNVELDEEGAALGLGDSDEVFDAGFQVSQSGGRADGMLRLTALVVRGQHGNNVLDGLDLHIGAGEIVGLAGVEGNGQGALVDALAGLAELHSGSFSIVDAGDQERNLTVADLGIIPADRHDSGCVLEMSVAENMVMNDVDTVSRRGVLVRRQIDEFAQQLIDEFDIAAPGPQVPMWTLSGGNQQKVILARELSRRPRFIIAEQPTRGLDIGAMEYMWARLRRAADEGAGVLLVSTEIDEILALSTRVAVIFRGRIIGEMSRPQVDLERLGLMMGGQAA